MGKMQVLGGQWKISGQAESIGGELYYDKDERYIALRLIIATDEGACIPQLCGLGEVPFITGTLFSGAKVVLYRCRTGQRTEHIPSYTSLVVYAEYAFWGLDVDNKDDLLFKGACVDFGDILNWYDLCKYEHELLDEGSPGAYTWNNEKPITLTINANLSVSFAPSTTVYFGELFDRKLSLDQTVWVRFEYKDDVSWETIIKDIECIENLVGVGTAQNVEIDELKYKHRSKFVDLQSLGGERYWEEFDVLLGTGRVTATQKKHEFDFLFTLKEFLAVDNGTRNWVDNYDKLKPILDLYYNVQRGLGSPEATFLSLVQALETFHSRFVTNSLKVYKTRVEKMVARYETDEIKKEWEDFLIDEGQKTREKRDEIYLRSRIADLIYADGELPLRCGFGGSIIPTTAVQQLCDTRNYYTHYDKKKKEKAYSVEELPTINGYLMCLLEYHLMILLGFDPQKTEEKISGIVRSISLSEQIFDVSRKRYKEKDDQ